MIRTLFIVPAVLGLSACMQQPAEMSGAPTEAGAAASVEDRLSGSRLSLTATDGDAPQMVMTLREDGTSQTEAAGFVLTGQWQVDGSTLCQTDIRLGGMPSDDPTPQCVEVRLSGDRVTLIGENDDGSPETFTGTISSI